MKLFAAAACAAVTLVGSPANTQAQVDSVASPTIGRPPSLVGPPAPIVAPTIIVRTGPVPPTLTIEQALDEALARSPSIVAAQADVAASEARIRQAGYRENPELSLEVENFGGTGELKGFKSAETTLAVNQRIDMGGRRSARVTSARAELEVQRLRLAIARADLSQSVREQFARSVAASAKLAQATENVVRARELARVAGILVDAGRDPPLRALRARSALAQAEADRAVAEADEIGARSSLSALFGSRDAVARVIGSLPTQAVDAPNPESSLEVRLAEAERLSALAAVQEQLAAARIDPAVGFGVRHVRETGDLGLVAGLSMPLKVFDKNRGNIEAARQLLRAVEARQVGTLASISARARNAQVTVAAAQRRVQALEHAAVPESAEALRLTELSYREGRSSLLELLDAQNAFTASRSALTDARLQLALATAELGRLAAQ